MTKVNGVTMTVILPKLFIFTFKGEHIAEKPETT